MAQLLRGFVLVRKGGPSYPSPDGLYMIEPHRDPIATLDEATALAQEVMEEDGKNGRRPVYVLKIVCAVRRKPMDTETVKLE